MTIYQVTYDLNRPGQNYPELIEAIEKVDSYHAQRSMWFLNVNQDIDSLTKALVSHIDRNDKLFVSVVFRGGWRHYGMTAAAAWLQARGV